MFNFALFVILLKEHSAKFCQESKAIT